MPEFEVHKPRSVAEAVGLRTSLPDAMYLAGGTDLLPNLKHHLHAPKHLVSLSSIDDLVGITVLEDGSLRIGSGTPLQVVASSADVRRGAPALATAAGLVAGPQHRNVGTLGGNVMLDTRCLFYNQTWHWRSSLGFCLKKEGTWCHVVGSKATCVAAQSSDTVPALIALGAAITVDDGAPRKLALDALYQQDGRLEEVHSIPAHGLITAIVVPPQPAGHRSVYRKVRTREAVDFPQLGVAIAGAFEGDRVTALSACVGAVLPKPRVLKGFDKVVGGPLDDATIEALAEDAFKQVRPQRNLHGDPAWRRHMVRVEVRRALQELRPA